MSFKFKPGDLVETGGAQAIVRAIYARGARLLVQPLTMPASFAAFAATLDGDDEGHATDRQAWEDHSSRFWVWFLEQPSSEIYATPLMVDTEATRIRRRVIETAITKLIITVAPPEKDGDEPMVHCAAEDGTAPKSLSGVIHNEIAAMLTAV